MKKDDLLSGNGIELPRRGERSCQPTGAGGAVASDAAGAPCGKTHANVA